MSVSGLSATHVREAVNGTLQAAILGLHHAPAIHYTQGIARWYGIDRRCAASVGQYPRWADCSAYATWCYWNGLYLRGHHSDIINGEAWRAGYTGTMLKHGRAVSHPIPGDAIIYGVGGTTGKHVALYTGGGFVVSHGSESGPLLLPWRYRTDIESIRRYI